ncbi:hypothetical protein FB562_0821 [Homoserinimonas aerilata]|uniref:Uncharacterized protein n=1 Tax=Homoserinimonas aerilata TaxID=1162970 RepID=A0A542YIC3_9MICO|nr:hypothetical protein [Homoserinimonas aerilata]TQL47751.1 hypothetical protein FB562_0821 [Homoserinimonas aerilata]
MSSRWARLARGWSAALFATYAAAFSHVAAGGGHPPVFSMLLVLAFSGLLCTWLAGRRFSRLRLILAVGLSQLLYHGVFAVLGQEQGAGTGAAVIGHHHGVVLIASAPLPGSVTPAIVDWGMIAAHTLAAAATVLVILYGEHVARSICRRAAIAIAPLWRASELWTTALLPLSRPRTMPVLAQAAPPPALAPLIGLLRHRGPPLALPRG